MNFCTENIADIAIHIKTGRTPPTKVSEYFNGNINWYTPTDLSKVTFLGKSSRTITDKAIHENRATVFDKDTVLISCIGDIGKLGIVTELASSNQQITGIALNNKVYPLFFYYWCKRNKRLLESNSRQAIVPILNNEALAKIKISYPKNYNDQIRISTVLTRAEKLIAKRKESIKVLDELVKSTFLEMFGLNSADYKQWGVEPLNTNTEIVSGVTKGKKYKSSNLREVPYMRVANVQDGHLDLSEIKTIEVTDNEIQQYKLRKGDLLLTEGGDPDKLGRGAVWNNEIDECIHQNHIFRVRVRDTLINPIFLSALIASKFGKSYFLKAAKQTTGIASINSTQLKAFPLIKPPLPLQNQFAAIVKKTESLKAKYNQNLTELENLYGSLSQRAFKGELDLSKVD